jgi:hypothetical protein
VLTAVKVPPGGVDSPDPFAPQHASVPSFFIPHVWLPPASTLPATAPAGAVASDLPASPVGGAAANAGLARAPSSVPAQSVTSQAVRLARLINNPPGIGLGR